MRRLAVIAVLVLGLTLLGVAAAGTASDPGVSDSKVVIGSSGPLTGEASAAAGFLRGSEAYFKYVNSKGGVNNRQIEFKYLDDAYDPAKAVTNIRQLLQQDQVFALFATVGTNNNLAIRDFVNASKVPQLFVATGATTFGRDYKKYPWTIGYLPTYAGEGKIYAKHILSTNGKKAKIAVLYQNDDYGRDMLAGLQKGLGAQRSKIVSAVAYDPTATDVQSQIAQLKGSGANTLCVFAFGKFAIQSFVYVKKLGWKPQIYLNAVAAATSVLQLASSSGQTEGAISIAFVKDPATPQFAKDAGIKLAGDIIKKFVPNGNPKDGYLVAGMASAFSLVDVLKKAGKNLTRDSVLKAATSLTEANNPFLVPGIVVKTTATARYPITQVSLERWTKGHWTLFGGLVDAKP
jgi:branched-chain amino acid transport system substrate-binding protein